ncbi:flagellar hook-associated protein FlgK [Campylobacter sp. MIT 97-5078]|uniref:flagellar hook-associated protein FlgK n=1 Tax=Campylobacter sp. MIT 97-5078 TaxID=1548153 RepID=UPI00051320F4|nr:flagellar hook-associated protein FlgK [Campylobacter sp. MIT 97-5078]KGI56753.1 flagellar hook protein FlgK [Campylobacter sp. MIT 97-5078]KGI57224.1 flagellar hook protein FlgK [Campylobacter sp. MIT 97-5078]
MSIFATLNKGVTGLKASEIQIATTGNNISNTNSTFYTRQRVIQTTAGHYNVQGNLEIGMGTNVETIVRLHDEYSYTKLKDASTQLEFTNYMKTKLEEIAKRFPDIQTNGILADLEAYNQAWNNLSSAPNDGAVKENLVKVAQSFTEHLNSTYKDMLKIEQTVNDEIKLTVDEINSIGEEIANINKQIAKQEVLDTDHANELRDKRDELELTLSKLVDGVATKTVMGQSSQLESTMTDGGKYYNLTLHGHVIVNGSNFIPLKIITDEVSGSHKIVYETSDERITDLNTRISGGKLGAQLELRGRTYIKDEQRYDGGMIQEYKDMMNTFAKTLITQTNNIYASSAKSSLSSDILPHLDNNTSLISYDKNIQIGTFDLVLYDDKGDKVNTKTITIDVNTTMQDIVNQINSNTDDNANNNGLDDIDDYLRATFNYDTRSESGLFQINLINPNYKIAIEDKGTNFSGSLNIGGFFSGSSASDIHVKTEYLSDPSKLRASYNGADGGNEVANALQQLQYDEVNFYNEDGTIVKKSLDGYYRLFTGKIATDGETNNNTHATNTTLYNSVYEEFQSLNGVNTNEELAALIQYQASYGAASKVVTTVDQMLDTLLGLKS